MDYEKAYKESFEAAKGLHDAGNALTRRQMEIVFPQLAESEDERIRKFLIDYFTSYKIGNVATKLNGYRIDDILAYLEKQKEQKPAEWNANDKAIVNCIVCCLDGQFVPESARKQSLEWFNKHRRDFLNQTEQGWSEEDEDMLNSCISSIEEAKENRYAYKETDGDTSYDHEIAWLKLLRNRVGKEFLQPHWKPSEEQMNALLGAEGISRASGYPDNAKILASLYEQLKRLRG